MDRILTIKETFAAIRALGLSCRRNDGEWRINYRGAREDYAYYTTCRQDALATAKTMIKGAK